MISAIPAYLKARLEPLGFKEWVAGFGSDNIPKNQLDKSYHLDLGRFRGRQTNHGMSSFEVPFALHLYMPGSKDALASRNLAAAAVDKIILILIKDSNRDTYPGLLTLSFFDGDIKPFGKSNDNAGIIELNFIAVVLGSTD